MDELLTLLDEHMYVVVVGLIAGSLLVHSFLRAITVMMTTACRERSRREIAAYIAEGSLTPEQGERLIRADVNRGPART